MDNAELRRKLLADPSLDTPAITTAMQHDADFRQFVVHLRHQQQAIESAINIEIPGGLASNLLQLPRNASTHRRWRPLLALAASVSLVSVIAVKLYTSSFATDLAGHALAHVRHEADYLQNHMVHQSLDDVNAKLASFDASLLDWSEDIVYARFCDFQGTRSLHLAVRTATGYATIFVVPKDAALSFVAQFSDPDYQGISMQLAHANVVVVSNNPQDLQRLPLELRQNLIFET